MAAGNQTASNGRSGYEEPLVERLASQLKAQPGKSAVTGALALVLVALVLRQVSGPRGASAAVPVVAARPAVVLSEPSLAAAEALLNAPEAAPAGREVQRMAPLVLPRDIFAVDLRRYPKAPGKQAEAPATAPAVPTVRTYEMKVEENKRQAAMIRLDGTVTGPASVAFLDGRSVREGEEHRGFRVAAIRSQSVVVEREGVQLELRMPER